MFPKIDAEAKKSFRALAVAMIAMLAFGMSLVGANEVFGSSAWFLPVAFVIGALYSWATVAFIVRTEV
ncbi:MAG: hypothetical protein H9W81_07560 [Enterococcus sp.]|nr:hypothetical protein [Enterococcus sp.]